ncbi:MAG: hypothetical protein IJW64_02545 [Clostridia bacterium]|nr:hypothetical protein [Clostridia bacterium]
MQKRYKIGFRSLKSVSGWLIKFAFCAVCLAVLALNAIALNSKVNTVRANGENERSQGSSERIDEMEISGVQLRGDVGSGEYFLVILAPQYESFSLDTSVTDCLAYSEILSKITLYLSESDEVGVKASAICSESGWTINKWGSGGLMFPIAIDDYATYNGSSVYKIDIEENLVLPYKTETQGGESVTVKLKTTTAKVFTNDGYGDESQKTALFTGLKL